MLLSAPRLDISLKKITGPSNLHTTYLSQYSRRCYSEKKISQPEVFFFEFTNCIYIFSKKKLYLEVCHFRSEVFFFLRIRSPRIPQQVGRVQIWRSCDFLKRNIQPRGIFMHYFFSKKACILKFVNSREKILPAGIFLFCCKYHRLEYRDK